MALVKFQTSDKVRIYSCYFDSDDEELLRNQNLRDSISEWTFSLSYDQTKMFLTEEEELNWACNHSERIYFDKCDFIFDIVLISYDMTYPDFNNYYVKHNWEYSVDYDQLRIEYLIYQDVNGDVNQRKLISRRIVHDPSDPNNTNANSLCTECGGSGMITLLFSTKKCDKCG
jgi:hypothetical protein